MYVPDNPKTRFLLTCKESSRLISDALDRSLSPSERLALRLHLVLCRHCRRFRRNLHLLRTLLHNRAEHLCSNGLPVSTLAPEQRARTRKATASLQS